MADHEPLEPFERTHADFPLKLIFSDWVKPGVPADAQAPFVPVTLDSEWPTPALVQAH